MRETKKVQQECYPDVYEHVSILTDEHNTLQKENHYLLEFIRYKGLEDEYRYFCENAHEEQDSNLPFPQLTL